MHESYGMAVFFFISLMASTVIKTPNPIIFFLICSEYANIFLSIERIAINICSALYYS